MSSDKVVFAQVDGNLDSNPKIRKGGREAREVFEFVLRRNAVLHRDGSIPRSYIDPEYLAGMLMMTCDEARHGTSRALEVGLIAVDDDSDLVYIVGWTAGWGRKAKSGAQRTQSWRERNAAKTHAPTSTVTPIVTARDGQTSHVTVGDESDASEKRRREKRRGEKNTASSPSAPPPVFQGAIDEFDAYYRRTHGGAKPTWNGTVCKRFKDLVGKHGVHEVVRRISVLEATPPSFPPAPWDASTFLLHFDKCAVAAARSGRTEPGKPEDYPQGEIAL